MTARITWQICENGRFLFYVQEAQQSGKAADLLQRWRKISLECRDAEASK